MAVAAAHLCKPRSSHADLMHSPAWGPPHASCIYQRKCACAAWLHSVKGIQQSCTSMTAQAAAVLLAGRAQRLHSPHLRWQGLPLAWARLGWPACKPFELLNNSGLHAAPGTLQACTHCLTFCSAQHAGLWPAEKDWRRESAPARSAARTCCSANFEHAARAKLDSSAVELRHTERIVVNT